ncbi:MAG: hypothetical protein N2C12_00620, partial [Planctomycetales bacterium]
MMMNKIKKLTAMSGREIGCRTRQAVSNWRERRRYLSGWYDWSDSQWEQRLCTHVAQIPASSSEPCSWWQQHMNKRDEPAMLLASDQL